MTKGNTRIAINTILEKDFDWLVKIKKRLTDITDYTNSSSALAEIRAYGALLRAGFNVHSVQTNANSSPDFLIDGESVPMVVEVFSKELDGDTALKLEEFNTKPLVPVNGQQIAISEISVSPYGRPGNGEYSVENAISRMASIKADEKQFNNDSFNVLWIDLQDESWIFNDYEAIWPIFSGTTNNICSGYIWNSLYGQKGLPLFEFGSLERRAIKQGKGMQHYGRFACENTPKKSIVDLAIISFPRYKIAFQNPNRESLSQNLIWRKILSISSLDVSKSWINWPDGNLLKRIKIEIERIEALNRVGLYGW